MMTTIVQTTHLSNEPARYEIPPSVLVIGKKRASEYIAPALFRIASYSTVEIRARGALSIATAVDVAELVKRNVVNSVVQSVSVGTDEIVIDGTTRRLSCIQIRISTTGQENNTEHALPVAPATVVVEEDPAAIVKRVVAAGKAESPKRKTATKKKTARKPRSVKAKP